MKPSACFTQDDEGRAFGHAPQAAGGVVAATCRVAGGAAMPQALRMDAPAHPLPPSIHAERKRRLRAIGMMLAAVAMFSLMDSVLKVLSAHYPSFQVAALRGPRRCPSCSRGRWRRSACARCSACAGPCTCCAACSASLMMVTFVFALRTLPLSTTYSIFFVAPLLITALSVPFLGEKVGPRRWIAIGVGLIGVLVVLRPTGAGRAEPRGRGGVVVGAGLRDLRDHRAPAGEDRFGAGDDGVAARADGAGRRRAGGTELGAGARASMRG